MNWPNYWLSSHELWKQQSLHVNPGYPLRHLHFCLKQIKPIKRKKDLHQSQWAVKSESITCNCNFFSPKPLSIVTQSGVNNLLLQSQNICILIKENLIKLESLLRKGQFGQLVHLQAKPPIRRQLMLWEFHVWCHLNSKVAYMSVLLTYLKTSPSRLWRPSAAAAKGGWPLKGCGLARC